MIWLLTAIVLALGVLVYLAYALLMTVRQLEGRLTAVKTDPAPGASQPFTQFWVPPAMPWDSLTPSTDVQLSDVDEVFQRRPAQRPEWEQPSVD